TVGVAAIRARGDGVRLRGERLPHRRIRLALAIRGGVLDAPLLLGVRARHPLSQLRVVRRVLHHALLFRRLELAQRTVEIAEVEFGDAQPEVRRVGDDLVARARRAALVGHLRDRAAQRRFRRRVVLRADGVHAGIVRFVPFYHRGEDERRDHWKAGSFAEAGSANWTLISCASPARTSTTFVIGARNAGLDSVISYLPGARSSGGAGVTVGLIVSTF